MTTPSFTIDRRFCGPPQSSNGGYFCGMVAEHFNTCSGGHSTQEPPPLNVPLTLEPDGDRTRIRDDRQDIGIALQAGEPPEPR